MNGSLKKWGQRKLLLLRWHLLKQGIWGFPGDASGKESFYQCRRLRRSAFDPWFRKIPWRRERQPTPVLPKKSHGQRSQVGYSPWGRKESDVIEQLIKHKAVCSREGQMKSV